MAKLSWYFLLSDPVVEYCNYVLWDGTERVVLRDQYVDFQCPTCKKVDELAAIQAGISPDVRLRSRYELFRTCDDMICVTERVVSVFKTHKLSGVRFIPFPSCSFFLMYPTRFAQVENIAASGMRVFRPCKTCQRPRELKGFPSRNSIKLPRRSTEIAMQDPDLESTRGRMFNFLVSNSVREMLLDEKVRGHRMMFHPLT